MARKIGTRKKAVISEALSVPLSPPKINARELPFETREMRACLSMFLKTPIKEGRTQKPRITPPRTLRAVKWGVYAFFDYDDEPIYVGQTNESLGARIGRHLTNQRTDAVAMGVLDPLE